MMDLQQQVTVLRAALQELYDASGEFARHTSIAMEDWHHDMVAAGFFAFKALAATGGVIIDGRLVTEETADAGR